MSPKSPIILGVAYNSDAGAVLVRDGNIIAAIAEERLNREKLWHGVPHQSINWVLKATGLTMSAIDVIATHDGTAIDADRRPYFEELLSKVQSSALDEATKARQVERLHQKFDHNEYVITRRSPHYIKEIEGYGRPVVRVQHHVAHAASAYYTSGWNDCYVLTADGWGTDASHILMRGHNGELEQLGASHYFDSLGYYYGSITKFLGFKPHRHEGKILGLAAHGNPEKLLPVMRRMVRYDRQKKTFRGLVEEGIYLPAFDNPNLDQHLRGFSRGDVAAAVQRGLEEVVLAYISDVIPPGSNLCLAGGIFANVLLNQKILALPNIRGVYIFPNMGDGGLAAGAAFVAYAQHTKILPSWLAHVYLGPTYSDTVIATTLDRAGLTYSKPHDMASAAAKLLADGEVVARFEGAMEFGPRALGNRSILYRPDDPSVNDWLNKHLNRTEFMPFAPVTLAEHASTYYELAKNVTRPAQFMTITCSCTPKMKKQSAGVVHLDGTARPQLITRKQNVGYYRIVEEYYKLTGNPTLINTSFNMHEEPIVCSPHDAIRSFQAAQFKYMAMGSYLVTK